MRQFHSIYLCDEWHFRNLESRGMTMTRSMICTLAFTAALAMASPALAKEARNDPEQIGNRDVGKGLNFYSLEEEIALGRQLASQVERQSRIVEDPVISEY